MKLNYFAKRLSAIGSTAGRWIATSLICLLAISFVWQGAFFSSTVAIAAPAMNLIAADMGNQAQDKLNEGAGRTKNFIRDTADRVERTANKNANRVDRATDEGSFAERKAKRDASRIEQRAERDASRTQKAVDNSKNAVERTIDSVKNAFD
jgi:hypothetical protein